MEVIITLYLFIYSIGVLLRNREYFPYTEATNNGVLRKPSIGLEYHVNTYNISGCGIINFLPVGKFSTRLFFL